MERVHFQQEQMLPELKDLVEKGLFTQAEIKHIIKKRTAFETTLVRRAPRKGDFLAYIAYESQLETLRRKRVSRLKIPRGPATVSDYALVRRQFAIFERAVKKFKDDVGLWLAYIDTAKREKAKALVGRISARALQLHPTVPALYILSATHELDHLSPGGARTLLQRGLRLNSDSTELWTEYVKMELTFVESLRRRWEILGISVDKGKGKADDITEGEEASGNQENVDRDLEAQASADAARDEILDGAIVKSVLSNAVSTFPSVRRILVLFESFQAVILAHPSPVTLKRTLLAHLHQLLADDVRLHDSPKALDFHARRHLLALDGNPLDGEALVEALRQTNEELVAAVRKCASNPGSNTSRGDMEEAYGRFIQEWTSLEGLDDSLRNYLIVSLRRLIKRLSGASPAIVDILTKVTT